MGSYIKTKFGLALLKVARLCFFLAFVSFGFQNDFKVSLFTGLPVHFIEPQHPSKFFWRGQFMESKMISDASRILAELH